MFTSLIAFGVWLVTVPAASAQPDNADQASGSDPGAQAVTAPVSGDAAEPAVTACAHFAEALDGASQFYGNFADAIEGTERPDYTDPMVSSTNTAGRTALREAAGVALNASATPGLQPDIAGPMRAWSVDATKLALKMGLRGSGNTLNTTATELNNDASTAQTACAAAGTHA